MKRAKELFSKIIQFDNLLAAAQLAATGKRECLAVLRFFMDLEFNLLILQEELITHNYRPGHYHTFRIYDPKPRMISAAPFRDRVVHHALMNVVTPIFDSCLIHDTYANRQGKGTHRAILQFQSYLRSHTYCLKCDIKKYFPSIDHEILKMLIRRRIADHDVLWLIDTIIDNSNPQHPLLDYFPGDDLLTPLERRKGLPIGNLTSQYFANYFLNGFDHFVKEQLHCRAYLRYVDDFALFSNSIEVLTAWLHAIEHYLEQLRLKLNKARCDIFPCHTGRGFLGQVVDPHLRRLPGRNVRRFRRRLVSWQKNPPENISQRITGWQGHAKQADTGALLRSMAPGLELYDV